MIAWWLYQATNRTLPLVGSCSPLGRRIEQYGTAACAQDLQVQAQADTSSGAGPGAGRAALLRALHYGLGAAQDLVGARAEQARNLLSAKGGSARPEGGVSGILRGQCPGLAGRAPGARLPDVLPPRAGG